MSPTLRRILIVLSLLAAAALALWHTSRPTPVPVTLAAAATGRVEALVANTRAGTVKACRRARLAPGIGGQVARLLVKEGDRVEKGQTLLELWNEDLSAQLQLARSQAQASEARTEEVCLQADNAEKEYRRQSRLQKQGLTTEESLDRAQTEARARRAACRAARADAAVAEDRISVAKANLDRTILRAPFAGVVADTTGEVGEYVTPSPPGIPTPPAVDLLDTGCLYVSAPIDEVDAPRIETGMSARITLDAFGTRRFDGRVRRIAPYVLDVEKQARTVDVEVVFSDPEETRTLLPGYSADAEIVLATHAGVLRIPTEAILEGDHVLVFDPADGRLEARKVRTGLSNWQYTEVTGGLREGERVVTSVAREGVQAGAYAVPSDAPNAAAAS